jgi:hypothetical protein
VPRPAGEGVDGEASPVEVVLPEREGGVWDGDRRVPAKEGIGEGLAFHVLHGIPACLPLSSVLASC